MWKVTCYEAGGWERPAFGVCWERCQEKMRSLHWNVSLIKTEFVQKSGEFCMFLISPGFWKACQMPSAGITAATSSLIPWGIQSLQLSAVYTALMRRVTDVLARLKLAFVLLEIHLGLFIKMRIITMFPPSLPHFFFVPDNGWELIVILFEEWVYLVHCQLCYICIITILFLFFFFNFSLC